MTGLGRSRPNAHRWWMLVVAAPLLLGGPFAGVAFAAPDAPPDAFTAATTPTPTPTPTDPGFDSTEPTNPQTSPTPTPTSTQTPTETASPTPSPSTPSPEPTGSPTTDAPTSPSPAPVEPTQESTDQPEAPVLDPIPPAATTSTQSAASWIIALVVLAASGLLLVLVRRRESAKDADDGPSPGARPDTDQDSDHDTQELPATEVLPTVETQTVPQTVPMPTTAPAAAPSTAGVVTFTAIEAVGKAMLDATYSVLTTETALEDIARVNGYPGTGVVAMPTALFVSTRGGGELYTGATSSGQNKLLLHQVDDLDDLVRSARAGDLTPTEILSEIHRIRSEPPPFSRGMRIAAYVLFCGALAVILGGSWGGTLIACVLGAMVGTVRLLTAGVSRQRDPLVTVSLAFGVSTTVFLLARAGWDPGVLPSLIAPLVILLPGALLTTGIIELSAGQMLSGAGRVMTGLMQLVLLAVGILAGASLVGVPRLVLSESHTPIGAIAPWIAVAAYGVGVVVHQGGRRSSIPWILLVLYVAYGAQVIGEVFFGGVLSALIGAFVMTPVAVFVARRPTGPAASVSFLPAFWLLVPGALGLVGVATILDGGGNGAKTLVTTVSTMVAIALGILAGSALSSRSRGPAGDVL